VTVVNRNQETEKIPYGVAIWTTGIGTSPLVHVIRSKIEEQTNRVALITDEHCKLKGSKNIFAIGDCATVAQDRMLNKIEEIFRQADVNNTGSLTFKEFKESMIVESKRYKQLETFLDKLDDLFQRNDTNKDGVLQKEEFTNLIQEVDRKLTSLPPTAQRASQQGKYLAEYFNHLAKGEATDTFKFRYMGSMSYIGDSKAVFENTVTFKGLGAMYLWKSFYLSSQYSWTNKFSIFGNWTQTYLFGRKISRE
jgi:NADH dehydrogenase FAD-containing subunit